MNTRNYLHRALILLTAGAAFAAAVLVGPAFAGTRDDVMSSATRCAGITDDRSWLDCYYGAAQPMRANLGLPPAPAPQTAKVPPGPARVTSAAPAAPPAKRGFLDGLFGSKGE